MSTGVCEKVATSTQLQYLGYPIPAVGQSAPSPQQLLNVLPFEIDIIIPKFIIHWEPNPEIGWWDSVLSFIIKLSINDVSVAYCVIIPAVSKLYVVRFFLKCSSECMSFS